MGVPAAGTALTPTSSPTSGPGDDPIDVAVVGGGPAGLIAAELLARQGHRVVLFERMPALGRKLLLAGRGGLNLTHSEPFDRFVSRYGSAAPTLEPHLRAFDATALVAWCEGLGRATFVGTSGRIFPMDLRANALLAAWEQRLQELGVEIRTRHRWLGWDDDGALRVETVDGQVERVVARATVLALGGGSWPGSGSDGSWVPTLADEGVAVAELRAANSGFEVEWSEVMVESFGGIPVKNVAVRVAETDGPTVRGELMITDSGLEGGALYAVSRELRDVVDADGSAVLEVDLVPDLTDDALLQRLSRRRPKDSAAKVLGRQLGLEPVKVALVREVTANVVPVEPTELAALLRAVPIRVLGPAGLDRAISSAGGVRFDEVDEQLMLRRRPGTFLAGEMLDWEAPTGGYLLQGTFSTGVAAAAGVADWLATH